MIAKIKKGNSPRGVINYVFKEGKDAVLLDHRFVQATDKQSIIQGFRLQQSLRPGLCKCMLHVSLSFSPKDAQRISDEFMVRIGREYMEMMDIMNTPYIMVRHHDREHPHSHLVCSRIDNDGNAISEKNDLIRSFKACRILTEKYGLYVATGKVSVNRDRLRGADAALYKIHDALVRLVPECSNWNQLKDALKAEGIAVEFKYKSGTAEIQGVVFTLGEARFSGSKVARQFSYSKLNRTFRQNARPRQKGHTSYKRLRKPSPKRNLHRPSLCNPFCPSASITSAAAGAAVRIVGSILSAPSTSAPPGGGSNQRKKKKSLYDDDYEDEIQSGLKR